MRWISEKLRSIKNYPSPPLPSCYSRWRWNKYLWAIFRFSTGAHIKFICLLCSTKPLITNVSRCCCDGALTRHTYTERIQKEDIKVMTPPLWETSIFWSYGFVSLILRLTCRQSEEFAGKPRKKRFLPWGCLAKTTTKWRIRVL